MYDKLGDGIIAALDEAKFWTEVIAEYMEWDESSAQRIANQYKAEIREQIRESEDIGAAVRKQIAEQEEQEM
jgi:hypothetical protein